MMEAADRQSHLDPYEVHKENMQMLRVLPAANFNAHSAPNSPMLRRTNSGERVGQRSHLLSPIAPRKDFQNVTGENRSRSLTQLTSPDTSRSRSLSPSPKSLSPGESPIGSPMSVSERIIRTHFLSNTTGKPGSYLLKKSDELVKSKASPIGSPRMQSSPNVGRKGASPRVTKKLPPLEQKDKSKPSLTVLSSAPAAIVISPAVEDSQVGFDLQKEGTGKEITVTNSPKLEKKTKTVQHPKKSQLLKANNSPKASDTNEGNLGTQTHIEEVSDVRESIGLALFKPKPKSDKTNAKKQQKAKPSDKIQQTTPGKDSKASKAKVKKHHYIKYGNMGKSPGLLTPPQEPRGSKDLSAEMETWYRKERRHFNDLEHVEELSLGQSEEHDDDQNISEDPSAALKEPPKVFAMPPVFDNVPLQLRARDFSVPTEFDDEIDEEKWEQIKQCRYLRIEEDGDVSDSEEEEDEEVSDNNDD